MLSLHFAMLFVVVDSLHLKNYFRSLLQFINDAMTCNTAQAKAPKSQSRVIVAGVELQRHEFNAKCDLQINFQ